VVEGLGGHIVFLVFGFGLVVFRLHHSTPFRSDHKNILTYF
jgi:hypothetical protein